MCSINRQSYFRFCLVCLKPNKTPHRRFLVFYYYYYLDLLAHNIKYDDDITINIKMKH